MISSGPASSQITWTAGDGEICDAVDAWQNSPDAFETRTLSESAYRKVVMLSSPALKSSVAVKVFLPATVRRTLAKRWIARIKGVTRQSAAEREWAALGRLAATGVSISEPLAFGRQRGGGAVMVTRYVANAKTLDAALIGYPFEQRRLLRSVGALVHRFHKSGYLHGDLHIGNILIGDSGPVLVDLQRVREIKRPDDRLQDLAFLDFSLFHLGVSQFNRLRFRIAALGLGPFRVAHERQMLRDIGQASQARGVEYYAGRTRKTLRAGEGFAAVCDRDWKGLRKSDFPEASVQAALAAHRAMALTGGEGMLKFDHRSQVSRVEVRDVSVIVKQVVKTSLRKQLADVFRGSAARRAWVGGHGLQLRGLDAATPYAFFEKRRYGVPTESIVLLEDLSVWPRVSDITPDEPGAATLPGQLTKLIIELHRNQVVHGDLQSIHIYLKGQAKGAIAALIDLEGVRFTRALQDQDRIQMLAQLNASIGEGVISTHERIDMMERYLHALPFERGNERALKKVVKLSRARDQRWKGPSA